MRRAADLYAGAAKTDPKDAAMLADYARRNADRLTWPEPSDELLVRLRILNGRDADLAADATRATDRLRDALLTVSPALERALGDKLATSGGARDALARWGTPTALRSAGRARIRTRIAKRSPRTADRLTDAISAALDAQTITVTAEATWGHTITELVRCPQTFARVLFLWCFMLLVGVVGPSGGLSRLGFGRVRGVARRAGRGLGRWRCASAGRHAADGSTLCGWGAGSC